jgi:hypothetical protein
MPINEQLELTARVAAAEHLVRRWDLHHPARTDLTTSDEIAEALRAGSPHDNDRLLLRLAELAHVDGGGSLDAAAVLAKLVLPGVGVRLRRCAPVRSRSEVDQHAAALLWIACRTFPYRTTHWVATTIAWRVFRATQHELGRGGQSPTWAATVVAGDPAWWADDAVDDEPDREAVEDLADLLRWARSNGVLTIDDANLLTTLVRVSSQLPASRITRHGLLSAQVSQAVAVQLGVGESTVRRHVARILNQLREAGPAYMTAIAS